MKRIQRGNLQVEDKLVEFLDNEAIPGTGIDPNFFWAEFDKAVHYLSPINKNLIEKRQIIQKKIDEWHKKNNGKDFDKKEYTDFLKSASYIAEEKEDFKIETSNVDQEIASIAGPQLVVPVDNARYALNAANARWGSLYDALYGTDVIPGNKSKDFNEERAKKVITYVRNFLDAAAPITDTSWNEISGIKVKEKDLVFLSANKESNLKDKNQFIGFNGEKNKPTSILIKNNNLHIDILIDPNHMIGKSDKASFLILF